jgi:hypothetical protein
MVHAMYPLVSIPENVHIEQLRNNLTTLYQMKPLIGLHIIYFYKYTPATLAEDRL